MSTVSEINPRAKKAVRALLRRIGDRSLGRDNLDELLTPENRNAWGLPSITSHQLANYLVREKVISELRLEFPSRNFVRYLHGSPSAYEVAQSINREGYLSHFTAMHLHQLTDQLPKTIYLNVEQHLSSGGGVLEQASINRAFSRPCRITHNAAIYGSLKIIAINGGNTGCLGVEDLVAGDGAHMRVTSIERTLIDAVVRPIYSGGVFEVARAYSAAKGRASVEVLAQILRKLNYTYPYHQSIGFYLEKAGFGRKEVDLMRAIPIEFDFFLDYAMRQTEYNSRWRLNISKGF